jgi:hypothetical protein
LHIRHQNAIGNRNAYRILRLQFPRRLQHKGLRARADTSLNERERSRECKSDKNETYSKVKIMKTMKILPDALGLCSPQKSGALIEKGDSSRWSSTGILQNWAESQEKLLRDVTKLASNSSETKSSF